MRLIDADALFTWHKGSRTKYPVTKDHSAYETIMMYEVFDEIDAAPTIEAEQVVRCKDCHWGRKACGNIECFVDSNIPTEYHGYEWFCPNGEKKDNEID